LIEIDWPDHAPESLSGHSFQLGNWTAEFSETSYTINFETERETGTYVAQRLPKNHWSVDLHGPDQAIIPEKLDLYYDSANEGLFTLGRKWSNGTYNTAVGLFTDVTPGASQVR
jgi:hypothetical protein